MKRHARFCHGIETLLTEGTKLLKGRRVGLLAHPASVDTSGRHSSILLRETCGERLVALYGPEHGFFGRGCAGEKIGDERHPAWGIPIHSLYGSHRRPTRKMLRDIDTLVFDLQDIGVRCYTFVSTLRYVMEECARLGKTLVVCDRPVPLPRFCDGPMPDGKHKSFVCDVPMPLVYAMTPGETAQFLKRKLKINVNLHVAEMRGWRRSAKRGDWGPWISPSPGIRYWETAWYYPATVMFEALPAIDYGRGGTEPFQIISAPWIEAEKLAKHLNGLKAWRELTFSPHFGRFPGIRMQYNRNGGTFPVTQGLAILLVLQRLYGIDKIWNHPGTREDFFDKLMGNGETRLRFKAGDFDAMFAACSQSCRKFEKERERALIYE